MLFTEFASLVRYYTKTDSTTFTDANIVLLANTFKDRMADEILSVNEDYFGLEELADLEVNEREYPLPADCIGLKLVEAKLDGTNWKRLDEADYNLETFTTDEAAIVAAFANRNPAYELFRGSLWILSDAAIAAVTDGLKIHCFVYPAKFTTANLSSSTEMSAHPTVTSFGWPRQFHELLARRVAIAYKQNRDKPLALNDFERNFAQDFAMALESIRNVNLDRSVRATTPADNGEDY